MSEAEWVDYDYECFQQAEDLRNIRLLNQDWEYLKSKGFIWRDIHGNCYKPKSIKDSHLKNILNHCKTHYRPVEQVVALQNLWYERLNQQLKAANQKKSKSFRNKINKLTTCVEFTEMRNFFSLRKITKGI